MTINYTAKRLYAKNAATTTHVEWRSKFLAAFSVPMQLLVVSVFSY